MMNIHSVLFVLFFLYGLQATFARTCGSSSAWVGSGGNLINYHHMIGGYVEIKDDCTFTVELFNYDGTGPDVFWFVGLPADLATGSPVGSTAVELSAIARAPGAYNGVAVEEQLTGDLTWDTVVSGTTLMIQVRCRQYRIDFGSVTLTQGTGTAAPTTTTAMATTTGAMDADWMLQSALISTLQHSVGGRAVLITNNKLQIDSFTYDGAGPDAYIYISKEVLTTQNLGTATKLSMLSNDGVAITDGCLEMSLPSGQTWATLADGATQLYVTAWCDIANANFGYATIDTSNTALSAAPTACIMCPSRKPNCLSNCLALDTYLYAWWEVSGDKINIELEAAVDLHEWIGFGPANPSAWAMIDGDPTIVGFENNDTAMPFVIDYYLTAYSMCNYAAGADSGVCPDEGLTCASASGMPDSSYLSHSRTDGVTSVRYMRKLSTGDACDNEISVADGVETGVIWATGPLTSGERPVVNKHAAGNTPGESGHAPSNFKMEFGKAMGIQQCLQKPSRMQMEVVTCTPQKVTLDASKPVKMSVDPYTCYPNPPAWGVSWHVDGVETPELTVKRGVEYTFEISGGDTHPFYIVDNAIGGASDSTEIVYAGGAAAWGSSSAPHTLKWTPNADTPDLVYYQCYTHQKLGWKINVVDELVDKVDDSDATPLTASFVPLLLVMLLGRLL